MNKKERELISQHPLFNTLTEQEVEELVKLMFEKQYQSNDIIVTQGEIVDAIYLILEGQVEVSIKQPDSGLLVLVSMMKEGDAIGIDATNFFSKTGERQATLTAITDVWLIGWKIADYHNFLKNHPFYKSALTEFSETLLHMNFIRQVESFSNLPVDKILWFAQQVEEIIAPEGTIFFKQGDIGDKVYLICSGKVEILVDQMDGIQKRIAIIEPYAIFGELSVLTDAPRNATARMIEAGKLLAFKADPLQELIKHHPTFESIMVLMIERCRPIRKEKIEVYHHKTQDHEKITILKDPATNYYFKLSDEGYHLWMLLDGTKNIQELTNELYNTVNVNISKIINILFNLADAGFVVLPNVDPQPSLKEIKEFSFSEKIKFHFWRLTHMKFIYKNVDRWFSSLYNHIKFFFSKPSLFASAALIFAGILSSLLYLPYAIAALQSTHHFIILMVAIFIAYMISIFLHELGHGIATKYFNRTVNLLGFVIIWFGLGFVAFVDTSDMWLSNSRSRIIVNLSGLYVDFLIASIASLLPWIIPHAGVSLFFYLLSLLIFYSIYKNLNPIQKNDGYMVLKELFNNPNLMHSSYKKFNDLKDFSKWKKNKSVLIFWSICFIFLLIGLLIAFLFQYYVRLLFPTFFGLSTYHLIWIIPSLVILKFFLQIRIQYLRFLKRKT